MKINIYSIQGDNILQIETDRPESTAALKQIPAQNTPDYFFMKIKLGEITIEKTALQNWVKQAQDANANFSYANYNQLLNGESKNAPTLDYQEGSIRDDFNFGALVLIKKESLIRYLDQNKNNYQFAGWYDFRLWLSRENNLHHQDECCYSYEEIDLRKSGAKQFDYVNPNNRDRQIEMEQAATFHLEQVGAKVEAPFKKVDFDCESFEFEASVIIPVLNREKTILDAIQSVLKQQTNFKFNLIIVDNYSTDKTSEIIHTIDDKRLIHHIPERNDLGIGGCWNEGINHPNCGQFAVQLDSDDLYLNEHTLQKIVDKFRKDKCAMVIGSYQMVNFDLEEIPPGIIDHREWSDQNGPNNALRINGLGAPRAFYTPIVRKIAFPNVSYGEDYAVGIAISREYAIGRIYDPLYLCRRWDDNTDANLSIDKTNAHNWYKDSLRTEEVEKRKRRKIVGRETGDRK